VGFVGDLNYYEMVDAMLGFVGIDISGDDGTRYGKWPWQTEDEAKKGMRDFEKLRLPWWASDAPPPPAARGERSSHGVPAPSRPAKGALRQEVPIP